jgi:sulfate adenylyltransferase (ADP) / ATP adenylyltransferase
MGASPHAGDEKIRLNMEKGTLWENIVRTTERAIAAGALLPVQTDCEFIEDGGMRFFVRILAGLGRKDEARKKQEAEVHSGKQINPFLPPEKDLVVADISDTHLAVLNKYNVVEHHLLIITRRFEDQDTLLTLSDFEALWLCMAEFNSLGFYNGGREAGASQQHKHLQLVALPLAPEGPAIPLDPLLAAAPQAGICTVPGLPFRHAFVRLDPDVFAPRETARATFGLYGEMLSFVGIEPPDEKNPTRQSMPYCFLVTREWMLLVPRSREFFENISFNSLAFAGSLFVRNGQQLGRLRSVGPMHALKSVAQPADRL